MDTTYWTYSMCTFIIFEHLKSPDYGMLADADVLLDFLEANLVSKTRRTKLHGFYIRWLLISRCARMM